MNRNQFDDRFRNLDIEKAERERKWIMHMREQEEINMLMEAQFRAQSVSAALGSVGGVSSENSYIDDYVDDYFL